MTHQKVNLYNIEFYKQKYRNNELRAMIRKKENSIMAKRMTSVSKARIH